MSGNKAVKVFNWPIYTLFIHLGTHLFYIEGDGQEGKVHKNLVLPKMTEALVVHVEFYLSKYSFRLYTPLPSVFQPFFGTEKFPGFLFVYPESVIQFYRPVSFSFKTQNIRLHIRIRFSYAWYLPSASFVPLDRRSSPVLHCRKSFRL